MQEVSHQFKLEMVLLIRKDVNRIVEIVGGMRGLELATLHLVAWAFLIRVQSEVIHWR